MADEELLLGPGRDEMIEAGGKIIAEATGLLLAGADAEEVAQQVFVAMYLIMLSQPGDD